MNLDKLDQLPPAASPAAASALSVNNKNNNDNMDDDKNNVDHAQLALSEGGGEPRYNSPWWDSMHDHTNHKAVVSTVNEDDFMTTSREFPNKKSKRFLDHLGDTHSIENKQSVINRVPGEFCIKDIYSGLFHGFALNEFIDQADTSTLNYLKYYESIKQKIPTQDQFKGLPSQDFPNSFLYNCDKLLYKAIVPEAASDSQNPWTIKNCKERHLYTLNFFWQYLLVEIKKEITDNNAHHAIEALKSIKFTDFKMVKSGKNNNDYRNYLYQCPIFQVHGIKYFYTTTQSMCAQKIVECHKNDLPNVKPRPEGRETKEQCSCVQGLNLILEDYLKKNQGTDANDIKSYFFMLIKYAGDTSHLVLYNFLNGIIKQNAIEQKAPIENSDNLALYLSERPLLVRGFAKNMNIYCKYLARFADVNPSIIKRPTEVIRIGNETSKQIADKRLDQYKNDSKDLSEELDEDLTKIDLGDNVNSEDPNTKNKISTYHPIIKKILTCLDLIKRTDTFIRDIKEINRKMVPSNFFQGRRIGFMSKLSSFVSTLIDQSVNKKNTEIFNRGLEYLSAYYSILMPHDDEDDAELRKLVSILENKKIELKTKFQGKKGNFKKLKMIQIGDNLASQRSFRDFRPHPTPTNPTKVPTAEDEILSWMEDNYSIAKKLSPSAFKGIHRTTEYLILYDILNHNIAPTQEGGAVYNPSHNDPQIYEDPSIVFNDLDEDIIRAELNNNYNTIIKIDRLIDIVNKQEEQEQSQEATIQEVIDSFNKYALNCIDDQETELEVFRRCLYFYLEFFACIFHDGDAEKEIMSKNKLINEYNKYHGYLKKSFGNLIKSFGNQSHSERLLKIFNDYIKEHGVGTVKKKNKFIQSPKPFQKEGQNSHAPYRRGHNRRVTQKNHNVKEYRQTQLSAKRKLFPLSSMEM